jgi:hypothetical protein
VIGIAATLISVYAAKIHRGLLVVALILAIPTLFQRILLPKANANSFLIFNMVLSFVFDVLIIVVIFRHVFAKEQASSETIFGALCIYLLVGFSFASAHGMWLSSSRTPFISIRAPIFTFFTLFRNASISFITASLP